MEHGHEFSLDELPLGENQKNIEVIVGLQMDCEWLKPEGTWVS
jgi:hypothetical protein